MEKQLEGKGTDGSIRIPTRSRRFCEPGRGTRKHPREYKPVRRNLLGLFIRRLTQHHGSIKRSTHHGEGGTAGVSATRKDACVNRDSPNERPKSRPRKDSH